MGRQTLKKNIHLSSSSFDKQQKDVYVSLENYKDAFPFRYEIGLLLNMEVELKLGDTTSFFIRP